MKIFFFLTDNENEYKFLSAKPIGMWNVDSDDTGYGALETINQILKKLASLSKTKTDNMTGFKKGTKSVQHK